MDAKNSCTGEKSHHVHPDASHVAVIVGYRMLCERRTGRRAAATRSISNKLRDHSFARRADENGISELYDSWQLDQDSQRMSGSLGESNPWVDGDASGMDARALRRLAAFLEPGDDLSDWIGSVIGGCGARLVWNC